MSELTSQEATAGISRRAIEILKQQSNGKGAPSARKTISQVLSAYRATSVIDTPMRKLEVLETADGRVIVRSTEYAQAHAAVIMTWLEYHEAQALAAVLMNLDEKPESESFPKSRIRAKA